MVGGILGLLIAHLVSRRFAHRIRFAHRRFNFDFFVALAEIFSEFCRRLTLSKQSSKDKETSNFDELSTYSTMSSSSKGESYKVTEIGGCDFSKMIAYLKKVVAIVKAHKKNFIIAEPAYHYVNGLYYLYADKLKLAKASFQKTYVSGKPLQLLGLVTKSYLTLGTNNWGTKTSTKNSVVGGTMFYTNLKNPSKHELKEQMQNLQKGFLFARTCEMVELQTTCKAAIERMDSEISEGECGQGA